MLPGGGVALVRAAENLEVEVDSDEQALGVGIVKAAAAEPLRQMAENAGLSPDMIQNLVESEHGTLGYDFVSGDCVEMYDAGIIDPLKVTRSALQNAASVAGILITTSCGIVER
jgi:chaperonin GroEL